MGRRPERQILIGGLQALVAGAPTTAVILEGEAGLGKSRLVAETFDTARILA